MMSMDQVQLFQRCTYDASPSVTIVSGGTGLFRNRRRNSFSAAPVSCLHHEIEDHAP